MNSMKSKDHWDKAEILIKILAGILIPVVLMIGGFFLNHSQMERNRILQESDMIRGFLPLLEGKRSTSLAALRVLETSLDERRVVEMAGNYRSEASIEYLLEKLNSTDPQLAKSASNMLKAMNIILLMDSAHPDNVYDTDTATNHGTNADDLYDALRSLALGPLFREEVRGAFNRTEKIAELQPAVIICHYSSFEYLKPNGEDYEEDLKTFVHEIIRSSPGTKFVIYSRRRDIEKKVEALNIKPNSVRSIHVPAIPDASFRKYENYILVINKVKELLNIGPTQLKRG